MKSSTHKIADGKVSWKRRQVGWRVNRKFIQYQLRSLKLRLLNCLRFQELVTIPSNLSQVVGRTSVTPLAWDLIHQVRMLPLLCARPSIHLQRQFSNHSWSTTRFHHLQRLKELPNRFHRKRPIRSLTISFACQSGSLWKSFSSRTHLKLTTQSFQET